MLAGGQSLIPLLAMRLAAPGPPGRHQPDRRPRHGRGRPPTGCGSARWPGTRGSSTTAAAAGCNRCCAQALRLVAHPTIRNRGTTVGSLAHADPSGEMTAVLALTGGSVDGRVGRAGERDDRGRRVLPSARWSPRWRRTSWPSRRSSPRFPAGPVPAFVEIARRHGDYALCGVAAPSRLDAGRRSRPRCAYLSVCRDPGGPRPDRRLGGRRARTAAELAPGRVDPATDIHASADYRRHLAGVLTERALAAGSPRRARARRPQDMTDGARSAHADQP